MNRRRRIEYGLEEALLHYHPPTQPCPASPAAISFAGEVTKIRMSHHKKMLPLGYDFYLGEIFDGDYASKCVEDIVFDTLYTKICSKQALWFC